MLEFSFLPTTESRELVDRGMVDEILIDFGQLRQAAYGILVIVLFLWMPRGVIPTVDSLWRRVRGLMRVRE